MFQLVRERPLQFKQALALDPTYHPRTDRGCRQSERVTQCRAWCALSPPTGIEVKKFRLNCPFSNEEILDPRFLPD